jgi:RHS repeat-associated protein
VINQNPIANNTYTGSTITASGKATSGNITFTAAQSIDLTVGFEATPAFFASIGTGGGSTNTQDYVGGIEYKNNVLEAMYHAEGRIYRNNNTWQYEYTLKDHLGNSRVTFADLDNNGTINPLAEILQENHYYPFGLNQEGKWLNNAALPDTKYQYNGKELNEDLGLNWNDYGARWYDAAIGRWSSTEPLIEKYADLSPYCYVLNNPCNYTDSDGRLPVPIIAGLIGAAGGLGYGILFNKTWQETAGYMAGGFVGGATGAFLTGSVISLFGSAEALGASGLTQALIYSGLFSGIIGETVEQGVTNTLNGTGELDAHGIVLSGVFGIAEALLGGTVEAAENAAKKAITSEPKKASRAEIRREEKELAKQIRRESGGQLNKSESKQAAKQLIKEAQKNKTSTLKANIEKTKAGVIKVTSSTVTTSASEEGQDKVKNNK